MKFPVNLPYYEEKIKSYEAYSVENGKIILYGSSFFCNWGYENARMQMQKASKGRLCTVNHGFGGATADDLLYHYSRMIRPYKPKAILFRMGPNDIFHGFSAKEAWDISMRVLEWAKADFPDIRLGLLCIFEYESSTFENRIKFMEYDNYAKEYALENDNVDFIDIKDFFYKDKKSIGTFTGFKEIFKEDKLHLSEQGYLEFSEYFSKRLLDLGYGSL